VASQRAEHRGWLSHGLAALAISALGLAVAGSVSLTTSAQPLAAPAPAAGTLQSGAAGSSVPGTTILPGSSVSGTPSEVETAASDPRLAAFTRPLAVDDTSRSARLQAAVVKERAAQRAEDLAKSAEEATQAAREAGGAARSQEIATSERATRQAAVKIAQERLAAAIRKRVAAETERQGVEITDTTAPSTTTPGIDLTTTVPAGGGSASPVPGAVIGAHFGQYGSWSRYHTGLDFRASYGTPIKAVADGVVVYAGNSGDWAGNHIAVRHAGSVTSMSSHMSSMAVSSGQSVKAGQTIGYVGSTGRSFGPHLHFELYPAGVRYGDVYRAVNPVPWLRTIGVDVN
jgi:murein DD-endopeptidase MepM/ murein hydrolase activator NlpD